MAFAVKVPTASPSSSAPAPSTLPLPIRPRATVMTPAGRRVEGRALAAVAPPAPAPVEPAPAAAAAGVAGKRGRLSSVSQTLSRVRAKGKTAFIPYITAGDPDLATTAEALRLLDACGADVIELGMPFSDPYADGAVIQASAARALAGGATASAVFRMLKEVTPELSCPVVLFCYFGPIMRRGAATFTAAAKEAGVQGLIVPDLPYAEICSLRNEAIKNSLELVLLTTPTTSSERMKEITKASEGFVYLVSVNGVTGPQPNVNPRVKDLLQEIRQVTNKAVAVGFGISTPDHVRQIAEWGADGVIIGSVMVKQLGEAASPKEGLKRLEEYAMNLKNALP